MKVLVLGATGYVGGRLVPRLLEATHDVRCMVRMPAKARSRRWSEKAEIFPGDVLDRQAVRSAMDGVEAVYYLIHSMEAGSDQFESVDARAARIIADEAAAAGVGQIIYLGGLGDDSKKLSPHLRSRQEVGQLLGATGIPVTELRAAVIVGSGSLSFELIHHLVNRLPVMICPRWVFTLTQPIAIRDVLEYLLQALENAEARGRVIEIGGPDVMTYGQMMLAVARQLGLRRWLISVPLLTPRLSSYWVNLVTPIQTHTARALIESLRYETICRDNSARDLFDIKPLPFETATRLALAKYSAREVETNWTDAGGLMPTPQSDDHHLLNDQRSVDVNADAAAVFRVIKSLGGENGWFFANWLWSLRGFIDKQIGGVGVRRGRRHPAELQVGDALDFWRVQEIVPDRKLLLRAEMKVWGQAWLEFTVQAKGSGGTELIQSARYYPRGLFGLIYWYLTYPLHVWVFQGLLNQISRRAGEVAHSG